jgi:hypothetical protein
MLAVAYPLGAFQWSAGRQRFFVSSLKHISFVSRAIRIARHKNRAIRIARRSYGIRRVVGGPTAKAMLPR